jgi:hypothetical protein
LLIPEYHKSILFSCQGGPDAAGAVIFERSRPLCGKVTSRLIHICQKFFDFLFVGVVQIAGRSSGKSHI